LARRSDGSFLVIKGILASDKANDLAILQAEGRNLPFVPLGDSDGVKVGEAVCVIGSPMLLEGTVSAGIISAVQELQDGRKLLQITAPISKGSSGSPVFNRKGEVIGVASFILSEGQNLNLVVPSNAVKALLRRLGITLSPLPPSPTLSFEERFERAYQEAIQVAQKIENASVRSEALRFIAEATAEAGQTERANQVFQLALQAAQKIEDAGYRSRVLKEIVEAMVKAGQFDLALQVAQKIEDARDRFWALRGIAEAMAEAGQKERAKKPLNLPSKSPRKLKTQRLVLGRLVALPKRWRKRGKRNGLIKSSNLPSKPPRKLKTHGFVLWRLVALPKRWRKQGNLTLPSKSPRKLKTQRLVFGRLGALPKRWRKRGKRNGLIKSSNLPSKSPRKLKTHGLVLWRSGRSPKHWRK
jgi:aryl carrier-like protein